MVLQDGLTGVVLFLLVSICRQLATLELRKLLNGATHVDLVNMSQSLFRKKVAAIYVFFAHFSFPYQSILSLSLSLKQLTPSSTIAANAQMTGNEKSGVLATNRKLETMRQTATQKRTLGEHHQKQMPHLLLFFIQKRFPFQRLLAHFLV